MTLSPGGMLSHYRLVEKIGEGGMGVVWKAEDTTLKRPVALKFLTENFYSRKDRKARFLREARLAAALNHPSICTIHEVAQVQPGKDQTLPSGQRLPPGTPFIVMEFIEGRTLKENLHRSGPLSLDDLLPIAVHIAEGLATAHARGIVHRDLKPGNVMLTADGRAKILDFGLAKPLEPAASGGAVLSQVETISEELTREGMVFGTAAYMSPEQAQGERLDSRSDLFSFGIMLYEMVSGSRPFRGDTPSTTRLKIIEAEPEPLSDIPTKVPPELKRIINRCLEKKPENRYRSAGELCEDLTSFQSRITAADAGLKSILRRPRFAIPILLLVLALAAAGTWFTVRSSRVRWARNVALPEIIRLVEMESFHSALRLVRQAQRFIPDDPQLTQLLHDVSWLASVRTTPPGAEVYLKAYGAINEPWELLGTSPLEEVRIPAGYLRFRFKKAGFEPIEAASGYSDFDLQLDPQDTVPPGMVHVPRGAYQFGRATPVELQDYWIDKYEVTNAAFQKFVAAGGYRKREYWHQPFVRNGQDISWEEAMAKFRDATGRPGPSTWNLGTYPDGHENYPVRGVSWYEAVAYAAFTKRNLPTVYHWYNAARLLIFSDILLVSNFGGEGPAPGGRYQGLGPYGTYDMAGNVREWCFNRVGSRRYILGGSWSDPRYKFRESDATSPFDRSTTNGFRLIKTTEPLPEKLTDRIDELTYDFNHETPVEENIFRVYKGLYAYDRSDLDARIESEDDSAEHWRKESVSFRAAYGNERVVAHLFLPRNVSPPYQTVVYFPGSGAFYLKSSKNLSMRWVGFLPRSGRALLYPVYKGTYERRSESRDLGPNAHRDLVIQWSKDLQRSVDYLESREDIDAGKLAFYGLSLGAEYGPIFTAVEERFKASVLLAGHLHPHQMDDLPEVIPLHFAPRSKVPVVMINGQDDFISPIETSLIPMFRFQGAPDSDKRLVLLEGGHLPSMNEVIKETLDWLDRYLGPVE